MLQKKEFSPFSCLRPRSIYNKYIQEYINVGCGHCPACLNRKARRYISRIESSRSFSPLNLFVTLTYSPECLPTFTVKDGCLVGTYVHSFNFKHSYYKRKKYGDFSRVPSYRQEVLSNDFSDIFSSFTSSEKEAFRLGGQTTSGTSLPPLTHGYCRKADVQNFFKRLRSRLLYLNSVHDDFDTCSIQYFLASEYGPKTFRPHYHAIIHCDNIRYINILPDLIRQCWRYGNVDIQIVQSDAASYVAKYINGNACLPSYLIQPSTSPFHLQSSSPSIGLPFGKIAQAQETLSQTRQTIFRAIDKRVCKVGQSFTTVSLSNNFKSLFFPKLSGFSRSDFSTLYVRYRQASYNTIQTEVTLPSRRTVIMDVPVSDLCKLSRTPISSDFPDVMMINAHVYTDYLASRKVIANCLKYKIPYYDYVQAIWRFYNGCCSFNGCRSNAIDQLQVQYDMQSAPISDISDLFCYLCSYNDLYHVFLTCDHWFKLPPYYRRMFDLQNISDYLYPSRGSLAFDPSNFAYYHKFQEFKETSRKFFDSAVKSKTVNDIYKFN